MRPLALAIVLAAAGCTGVAPEEPRDAGVVDAASVDAAVEIDAGDPPDAAVVVEDAGTETPEDAGVPEIDAGEIVDAGEVVDAGEPEIDAGPIEPPDERIAIEGYGAATRGGWQDRHDVVFVTSLADDGPGSLRDAVRTNDAPRIVRFAVDGTIVLANAILLPSNLTIDGRGRDVRLSGKGLIAAGTDDIIVTYLTIENVLPTSDDGIRIGDPSGVSERVVIDHVTLRHTDGKGSSSYTDEALSIVWGATDVTLAWLRVENWEKVFLFGNGDAPDALDGAMRVTVHHTYTHDTGRRHPQARLGTFDFYDDFFDGWKMWSGACAEPYPDAFGMLCERNCRLRAENVSFARTKGPFDTGIPYICPIRADDATGCNTGGAIQEIGSSIAPNNQVTLRFQVGCPAGTQVGRPYTATVEPADEALRGRLKAEGGNQQ